MKVVQYVWVRQSEGMRWKHILGIADGCVFVYELVWGSRNLRRLEIQDGEAWLNMTAAQILAWKQTKAVPDPCHVPTTESDLEWLREQLPKVDARLELLPSDYEACPQCGFDHEYEHAESQKEHAKLEGDESSCVECGVGVKREEGYCEDCQN
jgi:hypothetical protein